MAPANLCRLGGPPKRGRKQKGVITPAVSGVPHWGKTWPEGLGQVALSCARRALWATMGQVCFTTISSNRACPHGLHCSQFNAPAHAVVVRLSKCSMAGVRGKDPSSLLHCTGSAVACWAVAVGCKHSARLTPLRRVDRRVGPFLHRVWGVHAGQGSSAGRHLLPLAPLGHTYPRLMFGPWA